MESIECIQGQAEGSRGPPTLIPISEGISQDVLQSFGVQGSQREDHPLHLALDWEQSIPLFSGELRGFPPVTLDGLDLSSRERNLSGHLVESLVSGFVIHLRVSLTEEEGDAFMRSLGVDRMEDHPVVEMEGDMEVIDAEFECRDWLQVYHWIQWSV